jgi:hypothetical protein
MLNKYNIRILVYFLVFYLGITNINAQCPMCKANVEAAQRKGEKVGLGLNAGILFLLSMPYLVVGTIGIVWYAHNRKKRVVGNFVAPNAS